MKRFARPHVPEEELHAYADNEVSGGQRAEIAEHLMGCLICRAHHAEIRDLRIRTSEILSIALPKIPAALQANRPAAATSQRAPSTIRRNAILAAGLVVTAIGTWAAQAPAGTTAVARASLAKAFVAPSLFATDRTVKGDPVPASPIATFAPPAVWHTVAWEDAESLHPGIPHVDALPITAVRVERTPSDPTPAVLVRHQLDDGTDAWVVVGTSPTASNAATALAQAGYRLDSPDGTPGGARRVVVAARLPAEALADLSARLVSGGQ